MKTRSASSDSLPGGVLKFVYRNTSNFRNRLSASLLLVLLSGAAHAIDPPVITVLGDNPVDVIEGSVYLDAGATALDDVDGDITVDIAVDNPVDTGTPGTYTVTYTVTDSEMLTGTATRTVNVLFNQPPSITVLGPNPASVGEGDAYNDAGATASDAEDNDISGSIVTDNPVDTDTPGAYTVTYTVTDSGGKSDSATRTVNVVANVPPTITVLGQNPVDVIEGDTYTDAGATASDVEDGDMTDAIATDNPVNTGVPGTYTVTYTVTDSGGLSASETRTVNVVANAAPTITVLGDNPAQIGEREEYVDAGATAADAEDGDLTDLIAVDNPVNTDVPGNYTVTYTVTDSGGKTATATRTVSVAANAAPVITGQVVIEILEDESREITLDDVTVSDPDSVFPDDFMLTVLDSADGRYERSGANGNTIMPVLDLNGDLTVRVTVNDGLVDSAVFDLLVTVTPVNDAPEIIGQVPLSTPEDTTLTIAVADLVIDDPDNDQADFTLTLQDDDENNNYTLGVDGSTVTPDENFAGDLSIPATVNDGEFDSNLFLIVVSVSAENDLPLVVAPIGPQNAVENSPFTLNIAGNFIDPDGDTLNYTATWLPQQPPNISFDGVNGVFSGTPRLEDAEAPGPVYQVTVTALDPSGEFVTDAFDLTISALGRANLALSIDVTPDTGMPGDDLRWTFTSSNPVGPVPGENVELTGSFVGGGLAISTEGSANCTIQAAVNQVSDFVCVLGMLPVGASSSIVFTTTTTEPTEVVALATVAGTEIVPIDPNLDDNSAFEAAGVAESFSVGAVQNLGSSSVRSVAAGDINADGAVDLVVGTAAGQGVEIYLGAAPRESCQCIRDFLTSAISIPDTGENEGVALADFDNNGSLDLVVANGGGQADRVYRNDGAGNFTLMWTLGMSFAQDVAIGDFDNNGNMDIAIAAIGGNPVYVGDGSGGFNVESILRNDNSAAVVATDLNGDGRSDLVFANMGADSRVWTKNSGAGFTMRDRLRIGDVVAVAAADLSGDGRPDLVFGRVPADVNDIPSNPVLISDGTGRFGNPSAMLGISPTFDVHIGDVNQDGSPDLVFINASGVHQIWTASGNSFTLHSEQIIDGGAIAGVLTDLGFTDNGDAGGVDLAMGGAAQGGLGVYLNDSFGNLGRGDAVAPILTLLGEAVVDIPARTSYIDAGATAEDNIDGDITAGIVVIADVNTSVVGAYTLTYTVQDFAGNPALEITRTVNVTPAAGGGGGGGALSYWAVALLLGMQLLAVMRTRGQARRNRRTLQATAEDT